MTPSRCWGIVSYLRCLNLVVAGVVALDLPQEDLEEFQNFDPWSAPLEELASKAREIEVWGHRPSRELADVEARRNYAAHMLGVLQARAALEAAELQRRATEDQTETSRRLVHVTWWLVGVTALLATAAVVALFLGAS